MSIPLTAATDILKDPTASERLRAQFGGNREVDADGSVYSNIGSRPIPPPKALRKLHATRQEERQQRQDEEDATAFEKEHRMGVAESRTAWNLTDDHSAEATRRRRELAQRDLEGRLCDAAYEYEVQGCGLPECDGRYEYSVSFCHGAPVYQNKSGWTLHRDRPPVEATINTDQEVFEFGWIISKDRKPFYAARTNELVAPDRDWCCFYGPPPPPEHVTRTSWEKHLLELCGPLKDAGNSAIQAGGYDAAQAQYTEAIGHMEGYEEVAATSERVQELQIALRANRAEARLRLSDWDGAIDDSSWVLERVPSHAKAAARHTKACKSLGRWAEALAPLERALDAAGPQGSPELRGLLDEARVLASCENGTSELRGLFAELRNLRREWEQKGHSAGGSDELQAAAEAVADSLGKLQRGLANDGALQREVGLLLQGMSILDLALGADFGKSAAGCSIDLLSACVWPQMRADEVRRVLDALPRWVTRLVQSPERSLRLVRNLLTHRLRQQLKVADLVVEAKGLLPLCLRPWAKLMDDHDSEEHNTDFAEVIHELEAQVLRLDNKEGLALACFVECFIGKKVGSGVTGGFSLFSGPSVRQVVLTLLRQWSGNKQVLQSFAPELVGKLWSSTRAKLLRDAGVEVEKPLPGKKGALKLEWFKLRPVQSLRRDVGAFYPEELIEMVLVFLKEHLLVTCERGCEQEVKDGIAARHPVEEWIEDVIDKPFGWGVLLPLVIAPPAIASAALALIEVLVQRHPHNEKLANRLAGLHVFFPMLRIPWPPSQPAKSHLCATLGLGPVARRSLCVVLRCTLDTEMGMKVVNDHVGSCLEAVLNLLVEVLKDRDQPESLIAVIEILGLFISNCDCIDRIPEATIFSIVEEFLHSTHKPTRNQLAKILRHFHGDQRVSADLRGALLDERLGLNDEQRDNVMQEIFDVKTLAGQANAERMMELEKQQEQTPVDVDVLGDKLRKQASSVVEAIFEAYLSGRTSPRVLVMGRIARTLCRCLSDGGRGPCRVVLGETTLEKLGEDELGPAVRPVLLPVPKGVENDPELASEELFDLVIVGEPMGYFDVGDYADKLRPFIKRREQEDERTLDQVQLVCLEMRERLEDARDELYSAGYYLADHDKALDGLKKAAQKMELGVVLLSLPSLEKERRKQRDASKAVQRKLKRESDEAAEAKNEEEDQQHRNVLYETLFDPMLSPPESSVLPVAFSVGAGQGEADVVLFWLPGNGQDPEAYRPVMEELATSAGERVRVVVVDFPEGTSQWYRWTDEVAVNYGLEFYGMSEGPYEEALEKAAKQPAKNISFGKPSYEEMLCVEEVEACCKQLLNLVEEEVSAGMREGSRIAMGGFSQGGSVAVYAALSNTAPEEVQPYFQAVMPCCSGVPVFHFLAPKMQKTCLERKEQGINEQPIRVHMIYGKEDPEIKESYLETTRDLYRRFDFRVTVHRFEGTLEDRFPEDAQKERLGKALKALTAEKAG